jgi:hypothetical protein
MGEENNNLVTKEEMIKTIIKWYDSQLINHEIPLNYYRLFMKNLPNLSNPSINAFYLLSLKKLKTLKVVF